MQDQIVNNFHRFIREAPFSDVMAVWFYIDSRFALLDCDELQAEMENINEIVNERK